MLNEVCYIQDVLRYLHVRPYIFFCELQASNIFATVHLYSERSSL